MMRPTTVRTGLMAALLAGTATFTSAQEQEDARFRVMREVEIPAISRDELIAVPLDSEVYREAEASLSDLRVEGPPGTWNAFVLRSRNTVSERWVEWIDTAEEVQLQPLERTDTKKTDKDERGIEVRFRASRTRPEPPTGLHLITPLNDFEQRVRVFDDRSGELLWEGVIFDYSRYMDIRETSIPLPTGDHRQFRMVIDSPTSEQLSQLRELTRRLRPEDENENNRSTEVIERRAVLDRPFRIDRVELRGTRTETHQERDLEIEYPVRELRISENREARETIVEFETDRTPTSRLELQIDGKNFSRTATAESAVEREGSMTWQSLGSATLVHLDFQGERRENRTVPVTPGIYPRIRVRIENRDSPALRVTGVKLLGASREIVFIGEPAVSYRLHYGARRTTAPEYDVAAIRSVLGARSKAVEASLGPVLPGTMTDDSRPAPRRAPWNDPLILGAAIVILCGLLGIGLVRAGRLVAAMPNNDPLDETRRPSSPLSDPPPESRS